MNSPGGSCPLPHGGGCASGRGRAQGQCLSSDTDRPPVRALPAVLRPRSGPWPSPLSHLKGRRQGAVEEPPRTAPQSSEYPSDPDSAPSPGGQRTPPRCPAPRGEEPAAGASLVGSPDRGDRGLTGCPPAGSPGPRTPGARPTSRAPRWPAPGPPPGGRSLAGHPQGTLAPARPPPGQAP